MVIFCSALIFAVMVELQARQVTHQGIGRYQERSADSAPPSLAFLPCLQIETIGSVHQISLRQEGERLAKYDRSMLKSGYSLANTGKDVRLRIHLPPLGWRKTVAGTVNAFDMARWPPDAPPAPAAAAADPPPDAGRPAGGGGASAAATCSAGSMILRWEIVQRDHLAPQREGRLHKGPYEDTSR